MEKKIHEGNAVKWYIENHLGHDSLSNYVSKITGERDRRNALFRSVNQKLSRITRKAVLTKTNADTLYATTGTTPEEILRAYQLHHSEKKINSNSESGNNYLENSSDNVVSTNIRQGENSNSSEIQRLKEENLTYQATVKRLEEEIAFLRKLVEGFTQK